MENNKTISFPRASTVVENFKVKTLKKNFTLSNLHLHIDTDSISNSIGNIKKMDTIFEDAESIKK